MRRVVGAVAALSVLLVGSCSGSQEQAPAAPAPSPAGEPITVPVRADTPIRVDVPGVGTLSGEPGSVSGPGKLVVQPMRGQPALPAGVRVTGPGVDVSFDGTTLAKPLTLTFGTSEGKGEVPVVLHQGSDGQWEVRNAAAVDGRVQVSTADFSVNLPASVDPPAWVDGLWQKVKSGAAGRTALLDCSGEPPWMGWVNPSDQVHACATTNYSPSDATERAELQLKSNRGVTLEVRYPKGAQYVWVQDQPTWLRKLMAATYGYSGKNVVLLPAGDTMSAGWAQPGKDTELGFAVSGRTGRAAVHTLVQGVVDYVTGWATDLDARVFAAYMFAECGAGISSSQFHVDAGNLTDLVVCVGKRAQYALEHPQAVLKFAQKHGMSAQQASSLQSSIGKAARAFKIVLVIAPALQASWGNGLDGVQNLMTKGSSDTVTVTLEGSSAPPPPPRTTAPPAATSAPAQTAAPPGGDGVTCRQFLLASDADGQAMWAAAADAAGRPQVAAWTGRLNGVSVCQDDPSRSLVSVAAVVSPY